MQVDMKELKSASGYILDEAAEYQKAFNNLYAEVDAMSKAWQGTDNQSFVKQVNDFKDDLQAMYKLMTDYAGFLADAAEIYGGAQQNIIDNTRNL